jgi:hypothetical protein
VIRSWQEVLCPFPVPGVAPICNRVLVRLGGVRHLALANFVVGRPVGKYATLERPRVSVVVPARNEAGNVRAKLGLEIVEVPIRYRERTYGTTNIQRWRDGWLLLKMSIFAAGRIKFV